MLKFLKKIRGITLLEVLLLLVILVVIAGGIVFFALNYSDWFNTTPAVNETSEVSTNVFNKVATPVERHQQIILNLSEDQPLQTSTIDQKVLFAFDKQKKIATEWPIEEAGLLVKSYDGVTVELVGYRYQTAKKSYAGSGYNALLDLDVNNDNQLNQQDINYAYLYVWFDNNQNGLVDEGELTSLKELGIESININSMAVANKSVNKSTILKQGQFTRTDGSKGTIMEVDLFQDPSYREFLTRLPLSEAAQKIPNIVGNGMVRDLPEATMQNPNLAPVLTEYLAVESADRRYNQFDAVIFQWAKSNENSLLMRLTKLSTAKFEVKLANNLMPDNYNEIVTDTQRVLHSLLVIDAFTGVQRIHLFSKEVFNTSNQQWELHIAVILGAQPIMSGVIPATSNTAKTQVVLSIEQFNFTPEQTIRIYQKYAEIKKSLFDKLEQTEGHDKQVATQVNDANGSKAQWVDPSLQQQIDTGEYFQKPRKVIDYPRRRHLPECVKPGNIIDQQVRDCADGKIPKTW